MSRDGSGVYTLPGGFNNVKGVALQPVESGDYNTVILDFEADANIARPVVAGGTGGNSPAAARDGIDAEVAGQVVTDFNTHVWEAGSFYANNQAVNGPVAAHDYYGICYLFGSQNNIAIEVRDRSDTVVPGRKYIREKKGGTWGAWAVEAFVQRIGDTMSGDLRVTRSDVGQATAGYVMLGTGARFVGYNGTYYEFATDPVIVANPINSNHAVHKAYVDTADALKAPLASPALTGVPTAPTAGSATNNTQIATTAFANTAAAQAAAVQSGLVLITASNVVASSAVVFSGLDNTYEKYIVELIDVQVSSNNQPINAQLSANNGSSWGTSNYVYHMMWGASGVDAVSGAQSNGAATSLPVSTNVLSNVAGRFGHITIEIPNPASSPKDPVISWRASGWNGSGAIFNGSGAGSRSGWGSFVNAIQFFAGAGTITCKAKLYGMKK
jgi:hypothetical protein